jgi:hypothetical protein
MECKDNYMPIYSRAYLEFEIFRSNRSTFRYTLSEGNIITETTVKLNCRSLSIEVNVGQTK